MYLSRITLHTSQLSPTQLLHLLDRGEYVMHQWLWELFPDTKGRPFLYRREELQGAFRFFLLSSVAPATNDIFHIETRPFVPALSGGQLLHFSLRANPTICRAGKRHDLLMDAKHKIKGSVDGREIWSLQQQAACKWLASQGELSGFVLHEVHVGSYRQQQVRRENMRQPIQFSTVDYAGVLEVHEPALFLPRLIQGFGKSRAFGCGLMLIKPEISR